MRGSASVVATPWVVAAALSCTPTSPAREPGTGPGVAPPVQHARLQLLSATDRPAVARVSRSGDPMGAVAIAVAHDGGSSVSVALAGLLEARLAQAFPDVVTRPHDLGLSASTLVADGVAAARFTETAFAALTTPVQPQDPALERARKKTAALGLLGTAQSDAVAGCSGDLRKDGPLELLDAGSLEALRQQAARAGGVAIGALGEKPILDAATAAVQQGPAWAEGGPEDPWPPAPDAYVTKRGAGVPTLSVALRVQDGAQAIAAARALGGDAAARLSARLSVVDPELSVERISATTRPRGACLRLDLQSRAGALDTDAAAWAALIAQEEVAQVTKSGRGSWWDIEDGVLRAADPRDGATIAAWRALSGRLPSGGTTRFVRLAADGRPDLRAALARAEARRAQPTPLAVRTEAGQGQFWLLAASECGVAGESEDDAGLTAVTLAALARRANHLFHDIEFEAWVTPDSAGLLAHGPRAGPSESDASHAARIGDALGRALAGIPLDGQDVAATLAETPTPKDESGLLRPALDALSPGHPSWLEPLGRFTSLTRLRGHSAEARRRTLLREPMRLAALAPAGNAQAVAAQSAASAWTLPSGSAGHCPSTQGRPAVRSGQLSVEGGLLGVSLLAVDLLGGVSAEARWVAHELNRPSGLLDQALSSARLGRARARIVGGKRRAALLLEIRAFQGAETQAIAQVRALLARLAGGALGAREHEALRAHFERLALREALDPRHRLLRTWLGPEAPAPTAASLRRFCQLNLAASRHLVLEPAQ